MKRNNRLHTWFEIFLISTKLGLTSFGGPVAHLGYFHEEYVRRKKWIDETNYANLVALCQFLPGPASSQVGIGIGVMRGGITGGIISFIGFTLPSVIALILFVSFLQITGLDSNWLNGLKIVAVAVVAHAVIGMGKNFAPDFKTRLITLLTLVFVLLWQTQYSQIIAILLAGIIGLIIFRQTSNDNVITATFPISRRFGVFSLLLFFSLLFVLPLLRNVTTNDWIALFDSFYRAGALVFGGGHVVLPLLEKEFVPTGWINEQQFLAGYGAAQAVPGPLFTFAAYIGAILYGWQGGLFATFAIFLPVILLIFGALPFWNALRANKKIQSAFTGINAAVVGILIAALYHPIWTSSIHSVTDFAIAAVLFTMLVHFKLPPWTIVVTGLFGYMIISNLL